MKVFMSWSGTRSHEVATLLGDWLQDVIQAVKPWISSAGIDRGELWFRKISDNLGEVNLGIVCLTPENKENPWILFEAGALLKGLPDARVMTFLIDLKHQDVRDPLAQFNHTTPSKSDMFALVTTLNSRLNDAALSEQRLLSVFTTFWPQFEEKFSAIMATHKPERRVVERPQAEILSEVLETVRGLKQQLRYAMPLAPSAGLSVKRSASPEAVLGKTLSELVEEFVIKRLKAGNSLPEIMMAADRDGLSANPMVAEYLIIVYNNLADNPAFAPVATPRLFGGGASRNTSGGGLLDISVPGAPLKNTPST